MKRTKQPLSTLKQDSVDTIPSSNSIDSAMYERDKQIYKCSTMRQGGKWDPKYKPSILNCPLPEIPKEANESPPRSEREKEPQQSNFSKTLHRPPMKLPTNVKVIPPPKIDSPTSLSAKSTSVNNGNSTVVSKNHETITNSQTESSSQQLQSHVQSPKSSSFATTTATSITPNNITTTITNGNHSQTQGPNLETAINPNDESNYAVTEL